MNKWNQWKNTFLRAGKTDEIQLQALVAYLRDSQHIPIEQIKKDWYLLLDRTTYRVMGFYEYVLESQLLSRPIIHHPDIIILDSHNKIHCIIELDGSVHKMRSVAKKTAKRNSNYKDANIPCIVIDIIDLKYLKVSWFEFLDKQLAKLSK